MATKRDIRNEIKERTFRDYLKGIKRILELYKEVNKYTFIKIIILNILIALIPFISLFLLQEIINSAVQGIFLVYLMVILTSIIIIKELLFGYKNKVTIEFRNKINHHTGTLILKKITEINIVDLENKDIHNNIERASSSVFLLGYYFETLIDVFINIASLFGYIVILFIYNPIISLIFLTVPFLSLIKKKKVLKENYIKRWENVPIKRKRWYYMHVLTHHAIAKELKILNSDKIYLEKFKKASLNMSEISIEVENNGNRVNTSIKVINGLLEGIFNAYLLFELARGRIQIGNFNTYRSAFLNTSVKLNSILNNLADFEIDSIEIAEIFNLLDYKSNYIDGKIDIEEINTIEFKNVYFKYPNTKIDILKGVNFKISKGENTALVGMNGGGKTTIMKLILKIYAPTKGTILINGKNIKTYTSFSIRQKISMLMQDYSLFQETVSENIVFEDKHISDIEDLVIHTDLVEKINTLPDKFNTILGSWFGSGIELSKGQLQKLALSRIYARDSEFVFLDEPNAALDPKSEYDLFKYIKKSKKTCLATIHVFSNIDMLDKIIMIEDGCVVGDGTHKELYKHNKKYKDFYNLQERSLEKDQ